MLTDSEAGQAEPFQITLEERSQRPKSEQPPRRTWLLAGIAVISAAMLVASVVFFVYGAENGGSPAPAPVPAPTTPPVQLLPGNVVTLVNFNDVYEIAPVRSGGLHRGGFARVAKVLSGKRAENPERTLVLFAGDLLSPSALSSSFFGKQMVSMLNHLKIDAANLGNHDFDFGTAVLEERIAEANFPVLNSNMLSSATGSAGAWGDIDAVHERVFAVVYDFRISLAGPVVEELGWADYVTTAKARFADLKNASAQACDVVIALTHMLEAHDCMLSQELGDAVDLIVAGHDHTTTLVTNCGGAPIFKSASDLKTVWTSSLRLADDGSLLGVSPTLVDVTDALPSDEGVALAVAAWEAQGHEALGVVVGCSDAELDAVGLDNRQRETNLGNLFAEAILASAEGVDFASWNGGGVRSDRTWPAGNLTKATVTSWHPFGNTVVYCSVTGAVLRAAVEEALACYQDLCGDFFQVAGMRYSFDPARPAGERLVSLERADGSAVHANATYTLALSDFQYSTSHALQGAPLWRMETLSDAHPVLEYAVYPYLEANSEPPARCLPAQVDGRITRL